eukprot:gene14915-biopygen9678
MHQKCPGQICPDLGSDLGQIKAYPSVALPRSAEILDPIWRRSVHILQHAQICPDLLRSAPASAHMCTTICPDLPRSVGGLGDP